MLDYDKAIKSGSKLRRYTDKELLLPWIITLCLVLYEAFFFFIRQVCGLVDNVVHEEIKMLQLQMSAWAS